MNRRSVFPEDRYVARALLFNLWDAPEFWRYSRLFQSRPKSPTNWTRQQRVKHASQSFAAYARAHGRPDLAQQSLDFVPVYLRITSSNRGSWGVSPQLDPLRNPYLSLSAWRLFAQLMMWQFAAAGTLWLALSIWGPIRGPREITLRHPSSFSLLMILAMGGLISLASVYLGWHFLRLEVTRQRGGIDFYGVAQLSAALWAIPILGAPLFSGLVFSIVMATRLNKDVPLPPDKKRRKLPAYRTTGASESTEFIFRLFWQVQGWFWFRILPIIAVGCASSVYVVGYFPQYDDLLELSEFAFGLWVALTLIHWRFYSRSHRSGILFVGTLTLRRVCAWSMPLSLWLLILGLIGAMGPRASLERDLNLFLSSEQTVDNNSVADTSSAG